MKTTLIYLFQMIAASGLLYSYYHFFLRNKKFHRYNRFYLLAIVIISITIPLFNITVYFTKEATDNSFVLQTLNAISSSGFEEPVVITAGNETAVSLYSWLNWQNILYAIYSLIVFAFLFRTFLSLKKIRHMSTSYPSEKIGDIHFVNTNEPGTPFSFFRWLFWNDEIELNSDKGQQIFRHELFHITQRHSLDIFFMELITALAWFNPFFHLVKKEIKTIHEFLADEYAMNKIESWQYAELLLMQALNTNLPLVNPFFHNQIKRRIAMITTSQKPGHQYLRKLLVLPVAVILAALFAFSYKNKKEKDDNIINPNDPITIVVDAGHGGSDKGALTPDGLKTEASLALEISKTVKQLAAGYNINVVMTRDNEALPGGATNKEDGLKKRIEINNKVSPAAFISIHLNSARLAGKTTSLTGFDAYISGKKENSTDKILASAIIKEIEPFYTVSSHIKIRDEKGIYILDESSAPSLILECGYINNPKDLLFMSNKTNQEKIARAILNAVSQFANNSDLKTIQDITEDTPKVKKSIDTVYEKVQTEPSFQGGVEAWRKYLVKNLNSTVPVKNGAKPGSYTVLVRFIVDKNGSISSIKPLTNHGYGMEDEVIRVISNGPKWIPAKQNGRFVNAYHKQPVTFVITEEGKKTTNKNSSALKEVVVNVDKSESDPGLKEVVVTGFKSEKPSDDANPGFEKIETPPSFPGGIEGWRKYLQKNLNSSIPVDSGANIGTYTVKVKFIVNKDGSISSIEPLTKHGYGMEQEVIRIISKGPKWIPGKQNGRFVNAYHIQPVTFVITEEEDAQPIITDASKSKQHGTDQNREDNVPKISVSYLQKATVHDLLQIKKETEISAFTFSMDNAKGFIDDSPNTGNEFNSRTLELIRNATAGRLIAIDEVTIIEDGVKKRVPSRVFRVID